jgi:hypothetical protein
VAIWSLLQKKQLVTGVSVPGIEIGRLAATT